MPIGAYPTRRDRGPKHADGPTLPASRPSCEPCGSRAVSRGGEPWCGVGAWRGAHAVSATWFARWRTTHLLTAAESHEMRQLAYESRGIDRKRVAAGAKPDAIELIGRGVLRLRLYRDARQVDLERAAGVDQTTISRLERGQRRGLSL